MKTSANTLKRKPNILSLMPIFAPDSETMISTTNSAENGVVSLLDTYKHDSFKGIYLSKSDYINENDLDIEKMLDLACQLQDDDTMFLQYIPTPLRDNEKNLMLEVLQEYLPSERNGGWIPHNMEERKKMYPEAFSELKNYIDSLIETEEYVL